MQAYQMKLYILNLHNVICEIYLKKPGMKKEAADTTDTLICDS